MPIPDLTKIGEWTPTQLARFIEQTMVNNPPPTPDSLSLSALDITGDLQIGGNVIAGGLLSALGGTKLQGGMVRRSLTQTIEGAAENISFNEKVYQSDFVEARNTPGGLMIKQPGLYALGGTVTWSANNVGRRQLEITSQTGAVVLARDNRNPVSAVVTCMSCVAVIPMSGTILNQVLRLQVSHNAGENLTTSTNRFSPVLWAIFLSPLEGIFS